MIYPSLETIFSDSIKAGDFGQLKDIVESFHRPNSGIHTISIVPQGRRHTSRTEIQGSEILWDVGWEDPAQDYETCLLLVCVS